ncbi:hypothetical protein K9U40_04915 [Xanthobacter autotrophicus]|uniref:hypothetical protein n=1 Tax=Xanthobacter TaxID=279 RepID=UPI0024ABF436|nr:hypothetical protein [Xanthobacter autotrophicus]MDI4663674.1 hypothetical protein [Xanthobacter autotrophicus]
MALDPTKQRERWKRHDRKRNAALPEEERRRRWRERAARYYQRQKAAKALTPQVSESPPDDASEPDDDFVADLQGAIDEAVAEQRSVTLDDLDGRSERERMCADMEGWRDAFGI